MSQQKTYKQNLLRKYIDGNISNEERHELELLALDDNLLFEALESYSNQENSTSKKNINAIYSELTEGEKRRRIIPWRWLSAAASILLIATIGFLVRPNGTDISISTEYAKSDDPSYDTEVLAEVLAEDQNRNEATKELEKPLEENTADSEENKKAQAKDEAMITKNEKKQRAETTEPIVQRELTKAPIVDEQRSEINTQETQNEGSIISNDIAMSGSRGNATEYYVDGVRVAPPTSPKTEAEKEVVKAEAKEDLMDADITTESIEEVEISSTKVWKKSKASRSMMKTEHAPRQISGIVKDEMGMPLIGANVLAVGTDNGTLTDIDGKFKLEIPDEVEAISIAYVGFENTSVIIKGKSEFDIQLSEGQLLDEIVVTSETFSNIEIKNAEPVKGYTHFEEYLDQYLIKPADCNRTVLLLEIEIDSNGKLSALRDMDDINDSCSNEAISVINQYPEIWKTFPFGKKIKSSLRLTLR